MSYNKFDRNRFSNNRGRNRFRNKFPDRRPPRKTVNLQREDQLNESEVGITEYISDLPGFQAIIKARYSDFHVAEINLDGEIAKLTNIEAPADFRPPEEKLVDVTKSPLEIIPEYIWQTIRIAVNEDFDKEVEFEVTDLSKDERTEVHKVVKAAFGKKVVASTITKDEKKYIVFKNYNKAARIDKREEWPSGKGEYVHFLVFKERLDTLEATMKISDCLKMPPSGFSYAGVKDRRAVTTQWFSVRRVDPKKLIQKTAPIRNLTVGNITFKSAPLKLGQLKGNHFRIILRNVLVDDDVIEKAVRSLESNGFINYYGLQRFGNDRDVPTYEIGKQLLLGNWKEVCELILKLKKSDDPLSDITAAKKIYNESKDATAACKAFRFNKNKCVEGKLLMGLSKTHSNDYVTAMENIPRNMRLLYIHAFQSFIWNQIASLRMKKYGLEVVEGDLVMVKEGFVETTTDSMIVDDATPSTDNCDNDQAKATSSNEQSDDNTEEHIEQLEDDFKERKVEVKVLQESDLDKYTIRDVVLPLPGYNITYPENLKDAYKELLEGQGLSLEMPKQKVKTYSLSGTYRKFIAAAKNVSWKTMRYDNPNDDLLLSDLGAIKGVPEPKSVEGGKYKAINVNFSLNPSSYATMALRELLKCETSASAQSMLNDYHKDKAVSDGQASDKTSRENGDNSTSSPAVIEGESIETSEAANAQKSTVKRGLEGDNDADVPSKKKKDVAEKN